MWFDVIDSKVVLVIFDILLLLMIRNANKSSIEMTSVPDAPKEERVGRLILRKPRRFELREGRVMAEIVVLADIRAAASC